MRSFSRIITLTTIAASCLAPVLSHAQMFSQTNLVTDNQAFNTAILTDTNAVNVWGISYAPKGAFWVSNNGTGTSTLYAVDPKTNSPFTIPLVVSIPGDGSITGQVYNGTTAFNKDAFLFVSEDGTVSGWRGSLGTSAETLVAGSSSNVYKGVALGTVGGNTYLYGANFKAGTIDVIKSDVSNPDLTGKFLDAGLPAGYSPFNIQQLDGKLYVTYAKQNGKDDIAGPGHGYVDAYDLNGNLLGRVGSAGTLNSPWGLAIAPKTFGKFAGDLLVGNFGDGTINAFNLTTDSFVGQLGNTLGNPLSIQGLWGLTPGNDGGAGSSNRLYFSAGPGGERYGLFGSLQVTPEPGTTAFLIAGFCCSGGMLLRRRSLLGRK